MEYKQQYYYVSAFNEFDVRYMYDVMVKRCLLQVNNKSLCDKESSKWFEKLIVRIGLPILIAGYVFIMSINFGKNACFFNVGGMIIWGIILFIIGQFRLKNTGIQHSLRGYIIYLIMVFAFYLWILSFQSNVKYKFRIEVILTVYISLIFIPIIHNITTKINTNHYFKFIGIILDANCLGYSINDIIYVFQYLNKNINEYQYTKETMRNPTPINKRIIVYIVILTYQICFMVYTLCLYVTSVKSIQNISITLIILYIIYTLGFIWSIIIMYQIHKIYRCIKHIPSFVSLKNLFFIEQKLLKLLQKHENCKISYPYLSKLGSCYPSLIFDFL